jgi:hypothetical protein
MNLKSEDLLKITSIGHISSNLLLQIAIISMLIFKGFGPHGIAGFVLIIVEILLLGFLSFGYSTIKNNPEYSTVKRKWCSVANILVILGIWSLVISVLI